MCSNRSLLLSWLAKFAEEWATRVAMVPCRSTRASCAGVVGPAQRVKSHQSNDALNMLCQMFMRNVGANQFGNTPVHVYDRPRRSMTFDGSEESPETPPVRPRALALPAPPVLQITSAAGSPGPLELPSAEGQPAGSTNGGSLTSLVEAMQGHLRGNKVCDEHDQPAKKQKRASEVMKKPAAAVSAGRGLGCGRCRYSKNGCSTCKKWVVPAV